MLLTISVYDVKTLQMMPIGHALSQDYDERAFESIFNWFKKQFSTFLKPKSLTVTSVDSETTMNISKALAKVF